MPGKRGFCFMDASRQLTPRGFGSSEDSILLSDDCESFDFNIDRMFAAYLTATVSATGARRAKGGSEVRGCDGSGASNVEADLQVGLRRSQSFRESPYWRTFRPGRCGSATSPSRRSPTRSAT